MQAENQVLSDIVKSVFPDIKQYETDVPQNFKRPAFLFINPPKATDTQEMTAYAYKVTETFTIYGFFDDKDIDALTIHKNTLSDYLLGVKKILIPNTDRRYFTVETVSADVDDVNSMIEFTVRLSRVLKRDLRRPNPDKIKDVVNSITIN